MCRGTLLGKSPRIEPPVKRNAEAEIQFCLQGRDPLSSPAHLRGCNLAPPTCIAAQASTMTRTGAAQAGQIHLPLMRERGKTSFPPPLFSPPSHGLPSPQTIVTGATRSPVRHDQKVSKLWHKPPPKNPVIYMLFLVSYNFYQKPPRTIRPFEPSPSPTLLHNEPHLLVLLRAQFSESCDSSLLTLEVYN